MNLRKRQRGVAAEVHTSAMNDIMFFLLLFFLVDIQEKTAAVMVK